jgi:uncharacterized membrane protein
MSRPPRRFPWALAAVTVGLQIAYPLVEGDTLRLVTIGIVVAFALTCVTHATVTRGWPWALRFLALTAGFGLLVEVVGVRTGLPFGDYDYSSTLGPKMLGVPLVVPLAWTMIAYPVLLAARRLSRRWTPVLGGFGMAAWDVFLDPQMVADGRWIWADPEPSLPGIDGVPLTNFAGWWVSGTLLMMLLTRLLPATRKSLPTKEILPALLLAWTWVGYVVGNLFWFGEPSVALTGGVVLGALVVPYLASFTGARR